MAIPIDQLPPFGLTVLEGGRDWRADEAHVETIVFMDECVQSAEAIILAVANLPTPSLFAINEAGRIAHRAAAARAELLALTTPDDAA